jgi:hypothetical protein
MEAAMRFVLAALCFLLIANPVRAEVTTAAPGGFLLRSEAVVAVDPDEAWRILTRPQLWWSSAHTYSGDARRLRVDPRAGGCWCERWGRQSVEHARVVMVTQGERVRTLRLDGAFGPLQAMAATGIMTFTIAPDDQGTKITIEYRVSGDPNLNFDQLAPAVDNVLMEQFGRFGRRLATGRPD